MIFPSAGAMYGSALMSSLSGTSSFTIPWGSILGLGSLGAGAAGASAGGDLFSARLNFKYNKKLSKKQFAYQLFLLRQQQAWAEHMANTAHQREVADLRAAGLNPILSATGGNGATTPVVSAPSAPVGGNLGIDIGRSITDGFNSGLQMARYDSAVNQLKASTALEHEKIDTEKTQQRLNNALADQAAAQAHEINSGLPINRLPGHALKVVDPIRIHSEQWGLLKDIFDFSKSEFRRYKQNYYYHNRYHSAKDRSRFTVTPIGEVVNGTLIPSN